jgi:PilZ domain
MTTRLERRTQSRKRPVSLVYVELPPANGGMMRDLSEHGFSLRAMIPLQPSEKVAFSFILDGNARIDGDAIVVRLEDRGHVAALEFAGLSAHSRDQIRVWLDKYDESAAKEGAKSSAPPVENSTFEELRTEIRATEARPKTPRIQLPVVKPAEPVPPPVAETMQPDPPPLLKLSSVRPEAPPKAPEIPPPSLAKAEEVEAVLPPLSPVQADPEVKANAEPAPDFKLEIPPTAIVAEPSLTPEASPAPELLPDLETALKPLPSLEVETQTSSASWMENFTLTRAIGIMLLLTLIAGSIVYHRELGHGLIWLGQRIAGDEAAESKQPEIPAAETPAAAAPASEPATPSSSAETASKSSVPAPADVEANASKSSELPAASLNAPAPQIKDSTSPTVVPLNQAVRPSSAGKSSEVPADNGQQEYQRAQAILHAANRSGELPEAIRLLWSAVEKGNVGAEITLAELYRMGRGVSKNCAQAKILLATAARKGSPDAQRRLEALQSEGCEE